MTKIVKELMDQITEWRFQQEQIEDMIEQAHNRIDRELVNVEE
jgi:hypothetical protein